MFSDVPALTRMQMELVACATASAQEALPAIIDLLVEGSAHKRAAIVEAVSTNDLLREQWENTWEALRG